MLMDAGADLAMIQRRILHELPVKTLALWGRILAGLERTARERILYASVTQEMLTETGTAQHDADGAVEFMTRSSGPELVILFRELDEGSTRVSLRTRPPLDASALATRFAGGGHAGRAGFVLDRPLAAARTEVLRGCLEAMGEAWLGA